MDIDVGDGICVDLYVVSAGVSVDVCIEFERVHMCVDTCADVDFVLQV